MISFIYLFIKTYIPRVAQSAYVNAALHLDPALKYTSVNNTNKIHIHTYTD